MNWTLFIVLIAVGIVGYVALMFFMQRQAMYLSLLLYRQGDADEYLKQMESWQTKLFFNKNLRTMMKIDAYMMKNDNEALQKTFDEIASYHLGAGDRMTVLEKQMSFEVNQGEKEKALKTYAQLAEVNEKMSDKQKTSHEEAMKECEYLKAIKIDHSGKYADELFQKAKDIKDPIPSGIYYLKAAQSYVLKKETKDAMEMLNRGEVKLRGTPYSDQLKAILNSGKIEQVLEMRI